MENGKLKMENGKKTEAFWFLKLGILNLKDISTLLFALSIPNQMKATLEDVKGLNNAFDLFQPNRAADPYSHRMENFAGNATIWSIPAYLLSIYNWILW